MERLARNKLSGFLGRFMSYEENEVLLIQPQGLRFKYSTKRKVNDYYMITLHFRIDNQYSLPTLDQAGKACLGKTL